MMKKDQYLEIIKHLKNIENAIVLMNHKLSLKQCDCKDAIGQQQVAVEEVLGYTQPILPYDEDNYCQPPDIKDVPLTAKVSRT